MCESILLQGFAIWVSGSDSAPLSDSSPFELWLPPPRSFSTLWCLRGTSCCSTCSFSVCGLCFCLALLSDCSHRLRVPMMCDDSTVVASVSLQDGAVSRFPLLVDGRLLWCCSSVSTSTSLGFSARAVPLFWRVSPRPSGSDYGVGVAFFHHRWMPLSCALGISRCFIAHDGSPRVASPFLSPRPESQGGLLDCVSHSLSRPGALRFPSFLSSGGGWVESGRLFSLELWSPSSACGGCGLRFVPSPSRGSPGYLPSRQGMSVSGFGLSVSPYLGLVLQVLVRPSNLQSCVPPGELLLSSLRTCQEICAFLLFLVERFPLPGHRSSS